MKTSLIVAVASLLWSGSLGVSAQETQPATIKDPVSPTDCLRDKKKAPDCQRIGLLYATGEQIAPDPAKAAEFLGAACRADVPRACHQYGWLLLQHPGRAGDADRGAQLLEKACQQKDSEACTALGAAYAGGVGVPRDAPRAVKWLDPGCEANQNLACATLARLLDAGDGIARDPERAKKLMAKACELGDTAMCERACKSGDGQSCVAWGERSDQPASTDTAVADNAYKMACDAGAAEGCARLAVRAKDGAQAVALLERGCALGDALTCAEAARRYYHGRDVAKDVAAAARLYATACERESYGSCIAVGGIYARGERGAEEQARGREYLLQGCTTLACKTIVANGGLPEAWGVGLDDLRPGLEPAVRVGGRIQAPTQIEKVRAQYPPDAWNRRIQGTVSVQCVISPAGVIGDAVAMSGPRELRAAAVAAVRRWVYKPTLLDGVPVPVIITVTVDFKIWR